MKSPSRPRRRALIIFLLLALAAAVAFAAVRLTAHRSPPGPPAEPGPTADKGAAPPPVAQTPRLPVKPVLVSGPSPYAACTLGGEGKRYVNGEVETILAVNPVALSAGKVELIGAWMADRWSNGGAAGLVTATSSDGGATWAPKPIAFNGCAQGGLLPYGRSTDPWISFGPDGTAYASGGIIESQQKWAIGAAVSKDGGRTWSNFHALQSEGVESALLDKGSITADPTRPGVAYASWLRQTVPLMGFSMFATTTDGGTTWSEPRAIFSGEKQQVMGDVILVNARTGVLYHIFELIAWTSAGDSNTINLELQRSEDGGKTWTEAATVATVQPEPVVHPQKGTEIRTFGALPMPAIDPASGRLYVAWEDGRFSPGRTHVALTWSDDGGKSWREPIQVSPKDGMPAFRPAVAVNSKGQVAVSFYDFREQGTSSGQLPAHLWVKLFEPGADGPSALREVHVAGPFDMADAPLAPIPFIGDYNGLIAVGDEFGLLYIQTNPDKSNPTDVYFVGVRP